MVETALVTGITGQDGSYLSELLLQKGYKVYGVVRRASNISTARIDNLLFPTEVVSLVYGDLSTGIDNIINDIKPDVVFNMGSMSHVRVSFDVPVYTMDVNGTGPIRILEAIRRAGLAKKTRFYQASSSEMFGTSPPPQNEVTPFCPSSPYGIAKLAAYWATKTYRDGYNMFASNGILFNHESIRRGETFVTKKIVRSAVRIKLGKMKIIELGNLSAKRDWGHSRDYMNAVIKIMEHDSPDDFVVATGVHITVQKFAELVFQKLGLEFEEHVKFNDRYTRPKEVPELCGDPSKIKKILGWEPQISITELIEEMIAGVFEEEQTAKTNLCMGGNV
jgi:GDPmannose 4,6-dehydratase